jgi:hypothetical protein
MLGTIGIRVRIRGLREVIRATERLEPAVTQEVDRTIKRLAERLADLVRAAGRSDTRQSARAAATVRVASGSTPRVTAGPHDLLFGSEFGATRRFGWYAAGRYRASAGRQFRPHQGSASYWFFRAVEENQPVIDSEWAQAAEAVVRRWGA